MCGLGRKPWYNHVMEQWICKECEEEAWDEYHEYQAEEAEEIQFADPGGTSALRAATEGNPRNLPCPTCGMKDMLTPEDQALGYQCDMCAENLEGGY